MIYLPFLYWRRSIGATLIEMVVSLFVMGVGMMGVLGMQSQAMRTNHQAYTYSQAVFLAQDMLERIRANQGSAAQYSVHFDETIKAAKNCGVPNANCSAAQMRDWDIANWRAAIAKRLPAGKGQISYDGNELHILLEFDLAKTARQRPTANNAERQRYQLHAGL